MGTAAVSSIMRCCMCSCAISFSMSTVTETSPTLIRNLTSWLTSGFGARSAHSCGRLLAVAMSRRSRELLFPEKDHDMVGYELI